MTICGIVYSHNFDGSPVNNAILDQYDKQKLRGQQGFGVFDGQEMNMVHESQEKNILKWLVKYDSNLLLMHHRFPTSTINVKRAAHPFSTKKYFGKTQYILVHNGTIANDDTLFESHQELGIEYHSLLQDLSFNDSEALLWDFALYMEGKQKELTARGGIAFICLKVVKGKLEKMYFARNSSPLNMLRTKQGISLSSEGEGEAITPDTLYTWNYKLKRLTKRKMEIAGYSYQSNNYNNNYGNYNGYTGGYTPGSYAGSRFGGNKWNEGLKEDDGSWEWEAENTRNVLARQFGKKFMQEATEYEADPDTQLYLPVGRKTSRQRLMERKGEMPTEEQIHAEYLAYLASVKGHFEQAYWAMEADYEWYQDMRDTLFNLRKTVLLEKVMELINADEEYVDEESVSSTWSEKWEKQTTVF